MCWEWREIRISNAFTASTHRPSDSDRERVSGEAKDEEIALTQTKKKNASEMSPELFDMENAYTAMAIVHTHSQTLAPHQPKTEKKGEKKSEKKPS